jgi:hypothetical protein
MADVWGRDHPLRRTSDVVLLTQTGTVVQGKYNGYGVIYADNGLEVDLRDDCESAWRMVIAAYYQGEKFGDLPQNQNDLGQGYFYSDEDLAEIFGVDSSNNPAIIHRH